LATTILRLGAQTESKLHQGVVIEQSANMKSVKAWHAPSDPYYVLELMDAENVAEDEAQSFEDGAARVNAKGEWISIANPFP